MANRFSPSINIVRDARKEISYLPTANARRIVQQIVNDYKVGIRSFNIIGSYGTGKSAFLLALEQNLRGQRQDFESVNGYFSNIQEFEFLNIVGEYNSIVDGLSRVFQVESEPLASQVLWKAINAYYQKIHQKNACLVIAIDEFGKFLEYAAAHTPEQELYLIQQFAEFANDESKNMLFLTTLHQGFDAYSRGLEQTQRQEWEKVKGRLKELTFNEPVEMLLNLAAEHLEATRISETPDPTPSPKATNSPPGRGKGWVADVSGAGAVKNPPLPLPGGEFGGSAKSRNLEPLVKSINQARAFPHRTELTLEFARKLLPFDPLAGAVLTLALQRYGQNERSLFTFLQSTDRFGLKDYDAARNPYYNLACVFDYLLHNYYSYLSTKYNSDYPYWAAIRRAIDRVEGKFEAGIEEASKLIKTLGLLNIFTSEQAILDKEFLIAYARFSLGIDNAEELLRALEDKKVIRYRAFKQRFVLFEGTDLDFEHALLEAAAKVDPVKNVVAPLKKQFDFPYILAKSVSYQQGAPRFFNFQLSEAPLATPPQGEIDGTINLIFSESLDPEEVRQFSQQAVQAILYGVYRNTKQIKDMLFEIAKTEYVIKDNHEDRVAVEELTQLKDHQKETLNPPATAPEHQRTSNLFQRIDRPGRGASAQAPGMR